MSDDVRNDENVWWYCLLHNTVERGVGCATAERTEQWDSDPRWNDDE